MRYQICLRAESEGGFTVIVPSLPRCITWGRDLKHARKMAKDAIALYISSLKKHGEPIPDDSEIFTTAVDIARRG